MTLDVIERAQSRIAENNSEIERRIADNARWQEFLAQAQELVGEIEPQPKQPPEPETVLEQPSVEAHNSAGEEDQGNAVAPVPATQDGSANTGGPNVAGVSAQTAAEEGANNASAATLSLREQVRLCHLEHPDWPVKVVAAHLGCPSATVSGYASKLGLSMPSGASYEAAQAAKTTEALKAATTAAPALRSSADATLESRVRALHVQRPNFTARLMAKELGANLNSVSTLLVQIRKSAPPPAEEPEFSGRKEMVEHYGEVAKRLGKPK